MSPRPLDPGGAGVDASEGRRQGPTDRVPGSRDEARASGDPSAADPPVPHVVAWNLTRRCNLSCAHCYISAGSWHAREHELSTEACLRILDQVLDVNPNPMLILTGGEPLLRDDLEVLARHASDAGATVVVGTNGTRLTSPRIDSLKAAGVRGVALSVDSLDPTYHDRFRHAADRTPDAPVGPGADDEASASGGAGRTLPTVEESAEEDGAPPPAHGRAGLRETLAAVERLREQRLDFVVQTTLTRGNQDELEKLVAWSAEKGAVSFNLYFLVPTGRAAGMRGLTPEENEEVLADLARLEREYRGRMMIRSKCQPQLMRHVLEAGADSPLLNYRTRCPCGVHYCRITPEGKVTPCPYMPVEAGDLGETPFRQIWESSPVFDDLRNGVLGGRCGRCEYREVCGGCRARAYADHGDYLGPDDSCAYDPPGDRPTVRPPREMTYGSGSLGTGGEGASTRVAAAPEDGEGGGLPWTDDARERIQRIPSFVRGVVSRRVEKFARERDYARVDLEVMAEVRRSMPVDFSKRLPFFMKEDDPNEP